MFMKPIRFLSKILAVMASLVFAIAAFATPALADEICTITKGTSRPGGEYKADVYASASFSSPIGSVVNGATIKVTQTVQDQYGNQWARYVSTLTNSGFAYIPRVNLTNCKADNQDECYQRGYRAGIEAAKKALNNL
jgi:hypothetical protein